MLRSTLSFCLLLINFCLFAQNGTISGAVTDAVSGETVVGANVVIQGTAVGAATDIDGKFTLANLKPGTYNLSVTFVTYKTHTIPDVVVESGKITSIQVQMQEDVSELKEVVITGTREINNDVSLITAIKESKLVVSGISAEQITKLPDRDAAQIAQRVSGITIADNRFILIRGVPERYNQVMVNGIIGPSTEIDKRSFSFDLIPAGAIDQMLIYKSGSAEIPGDFAGGVIKLITKKPTAESFFNIGLSAGYRTNTTFQNFSSSKGSSTDMFGFDNGFRDLPSNFVTTAALKASTRNSSLRERAGKSLNNNFDYTTQAAPMDMGLNLSFSKPFHLGRVGINNLTMLSYANGYQHSAVSAFKRYNEFNASGVVERFSFQDDVYANDVKISLLNNWQVNVNDNFQVEFKNLFVQLGQHETTIRRGVDNYQLSNADRINYAYHYLTRSIYTGQLEGNHKFSDQSASLNWVFGMNTVSRNEPDYRRFRTFRDQSLQGTEEPYTMQLPSSGNPFETGRFWSELQDEGYSHGLNFEKKFGNTDDKRSASIRAGYFGEYKTRTFDARYINYLLPDGIDINRAQYLSTLPLSQIFDPSNIDKDDGFVVEEATTAQDHYDGSNLLAAGYVGGSFPLSKFDISAGFRGEYNHQKLTSETNQGGLDEVDNPIFAALPMMNVAYNISDRSLIRTAYSRTVNRPEFRELARFLYYQFEYEIAVFGNPNLKTAFINNLDLRWEMYPNPGELVSVGAFYKDFTDPIETYLQITSENPQVFYGNGTRATSVGVEIEFRKSLASLGVSKLLRNTSVNLNASLIESQVDIGDNASNQAKKRPLQGQSPYIINAGLYYSDEATGLSVNGAYNVFGPRIFSVGDVNFPSWMELPRNSVDFQVAKTWKRFETRLNIQNALNAAYRIYQDNNNNSKIEDNEAVIKQYKVGSQFSLSLTWKLAKQN